MSSFAPEDASCEFRGRLNNSAFVEKHFIAGFVWRTDVVLSFQNMRRSNCVPPQARKFISSNCLQERSYGKTIK